MNKLELKKDTKFCYSILESTKKSLMEKVIEMNKQKNCMLELRLDYLLCQGYSIEEIIEFIATIRKRYTKKKLIATIRTIADGGKVDLPHEKYFYFVKRLYESAKVDAIDVEYKFYKIDKVYFNELFSKKMKDIIISIHFYNRVFFDVEYRKMFKEMADSNGDIVKFAIKTYTKKDLFDFMNIAKKSYKLFKNRHKKVVFIAMGELGMISRIVPEYTNTKIVFLNAYGAFDKSLGQINANIYNKYRNLLDKNYKN